jgi:hypothetical protein
MSDIHLGANRDPGLQKMELEVLGRAIERCIQEQVDFILMSGDIFHVPIPDLGIVNEASAKMLEAQKAGIPIYVIYGSHDYTPTGTSIIDILDTVGVLTQIVKWHMEDGKLRLEFFEDQKTGAKLAGIHARKLGLESKYYERLDIESLEKGKGFKVFVFHSGLDEFKPAYLSEMDTVPISYLPKGFDYYAGGHIHEKGEFSLPGYSKVVYPGPLFIGYSARDIESMARGEKRGFYIVSFDDQVRKAEFAELETFPATCFEFDATGKNSTQVEKEIKQKLAKLDAKGMVVVMKVRGELSGGRTSDIDFAKIRADLIESGALHVYLNRHGLTSKEFTAVRVMGEDVSSIETRLLKENLGSVHVSQPALKGDQGAATAREFLRVLRQGAKADESKRDYVERSVEGGLEVLGLSGFIAEEVT